MGVRHVTVPDGRTLALDDVGDPAGRAVVYLHGTPDARQARHPDDGLAAGAGVRLLAVDRPGFGDSDLHPTGDLTALGHDLVALLDQLEVPTAALLGWSSGGLAALAAASVLGARCTRAVLVATIPPVEAYAATAVLDALGPSRRPFAELAAELTAEELAAEVAPYLLPDPLTADTAREHVLEGAGEQGRTELAGVPGAIDAMVAGLLAGGRHGVAGVEHDLRLQLTPGLDPRSIVAPVRSVHGSDDGVSPPEVGAWLGSWLGSALEVEVVAGAGHHLLFPRWQELMRWVGDPAG